MSQVGSGIQTLLAFLVALLLLIVVHEWGHFWVARRLGVKVLRFSIGLGKPLWRWRRGADQTEGVLAACPLGGDVRMLDDREPPVAPEELARAFNRQSLQTRATIVVAGPLANFLLAFVIYIVLYLVGIPGLRPYLDAPAPGTLAAQAGFEAGDLVEQVGSVPVQSWNEFQMQVLSQALDQGPLQLQGRDGAHHLWFRNISLVGFDTTQEDAALLSRLGFKPWDYPLPAQVGQVLPHSPAAQAGLQVHDQIVAINGQPINSWQALVARVRASPGQVLQLQIRRAKGWLKCELVPDTERQSNGTAIGRIGVAPEVPQALHAQLWVTLRDPPGQALMHAGRKTWEVSVLTFKTFGRMGAGQSSWKNVGGPIQIADYAGQTARMGFVPYLTFIALISISLGALNLLPVPLLDGGHLMYYAVELIKGSPLSDRVMAFTQRIGLVLLAALMGFALYNDIQRLLTN